MKNIIHKHHIIPKHAGGSNDPSNIEKLTVKKHAEAHKLLYEQHGCAEDRLAWLGLSGSMNKEFSQEKEEFIRLKCSLGAKKQWSDPEFRKKRSKEVSKQLKKEWSTPEGRKKRLEISRKIWADKEFVKRRKKEVSEQAKKQWADPKFKKQMTDKIREFSKNPEYIERQKEESTERWKNEEFRKSTIKIVTCPYCKTKGDKRGMARWHFENCKYKGVK